MEHNITLVVGDPSNDGHGRSESVQILSNLTPEQMWEAYKKATEKIGFDFCEKVARTYEDSYIEQDIFQKLCDAGMNCLGIQKDLERYDEDDEDSKWILDAVSYSQIFLAIVLLGNPEFCGRIVEDNSKTMRIGGYGLFS